MARAALRLKLLAAVRTDAEATETPSGWNTRCIHCRSQVGLDPEGAPNHGTTLEHIVPRSWFGRRPAADLTSDLQGPDDPRNLALACARCNQQKGKGPDACGPGDERARAVIRNLVALRKARFREA